MFQYMPVFSNQMKCGLTIMISQKCPISKRANFVLIQLNESYFAMISDMTMIIILACHVRVYLLPVYTRYEYTRTWQAKMMRSLRNNFRLIGSVRNLHTVRTYIHTWRRGALFSLQIKMGEASMKETNYSLREPRSFFAFHHLFHLSLGLKYRRSDICYGKRLASFPDPRLSIFTRVQ